MFPQAVSKLIQDASTNVKIDFKLNQDCAEDISKFCGDIASGKSKGERSQHSVTALLIME